MYYKKIRELLIFGIGEGEKPQTPLFTARRSEDRLDLLMTIEGTKDAVGYNILWGMKKENYITAIRFTVSLQMCGKNRMPLSGKESGRW